MSAKAAVEGQTRVRNKSVRTTRPLLEPVVLGDEPPLLPGMTRFETDAFALEIGGLGGIIGLYGRNNLPRVNDALRALNQEPISRRVYGATLREIEDNMADPNDSCHARLARVGLPPIFQEKPPRSSRR